MRSINFGRKRTLGVGIGLALAAIIPAASQARETSIEGQAAGAHSSQALTRLKAFEQARFKAFDDEWNVAPRRYLMH
jgi:hypothetical protein